MTNFAHSSSKKISVNTCVRMHDAHTALLCGMMRVGVPAGDDSAPPLVLNTRVSTVGDDVTDGWDAAACAAGRHAHRASKLGPVK